MIRDHGMLGASGLAFAAMSLARCNVDFLHARQEVIRLMPIPQMGYVWRRVMTRGRQLARER